MLSGRHIHLHQALGLGPMWVHREAVISQMAETEAVLSPIHQTAPVLQDAAAVTSPKMPTTSAAPAVKTASAHTKEITDTPAQAESVQRKVSRQAANLLAIISQAQQQNPQERHKTPVSAPILVNTDYSADTLHSLTHKIQTCQLCDLSQERRQALAPVVQDACRLIVVVPQPSLQDDLNGHLLSGDVATMWNKLLAAIGVYPEQVYVTSAIKCAPNLTLSAKPHHVKQCRPYLQRELQLLPAVPVLLLAENQVPLWQRLQEWCGNERVFRIAHPSKIQRNPDLRRETWNTLQAIQKQLPQ